MLATRRAVYFASKALTEAQKGYVAIELESLPVVWVMEKFHYFLYASHFILETRSEAFGNNQVQEPKSSHPKIAADYN